MLQQGIARAEEAVRLQRLGERAEAGRAYEHAGQFFQHALAAVKSPEERAIILAKMVQYAEQADLLRAAPPQARGEARQFAALERPKARFSDVVGQHVAKRALTNAVLVPQRFPSLVSVAPPARGILLFGPPGTGKTLLARALAGEAGAAFFAIETKDLVDKWVGDTPKNIAALFAQARAAAPAIIFIDEIDALMAARQEGEHEASKQAKAQLLVALDGIEPLQGVLLVGATNHPSVLDVGFRRRFDVPVLVGLPNADERLELLHAKLGAAALPAAQMRALADAMQGFSCADVVRAVNAARRLQLDPLHASRFFAPGPAGYRPLGDEPPCPLCPMILSADAVKLRTCEACGAVHVSTLFKLEQGAAFDVPPLALEHFGPSAASVTPQEAAECDAWARVFGGA